MDRCSSLPGEGRFKGAGSPRAAGLAGFPALGETLRIMRRAPMYGPEGGLAILRFLIS